MPTNAGFYQRRVELLTAASATSSTYTSSAHYVGDYAYMSVEWPDGGNSTLTLQGSNDDGFRASIATWSTLSAIAAAGIYTLDPGVRWVRAQRSSDDSLAAVVLQGRT
jgi:hypothetical protein